jgi:hypothetical protein
MLEPDGNADISQTRLDTLARLQQFDGSFELNETLIKLLQFASIEEARSSLMDTNLSNTEMKNNGVVAGVLAIRFMYTELGKLQDSWQMLKEKAVEWLENVLSPGRVSDVLLQYE